MIKRKKLFVVIIVAVILSVMVLPGVIVDDNEQSTSDEQSPSVEQSPSGFGGGGWSGSPWSPVEQTASVKPSFSKDCFSGEAMDDCFKRLREEGISGLSQQEFQTKDHSETEILEFVWNYKGEDNSGPTLGEILAVVIASKYPGEDILENPSTTKYYFATPDYSKGTTSDRYWTVELELQTYDDKVYFKWFVDAETNSVQAGNGMAKSILNILDTYDK